MYFFDQDYLKQYLSLGKEVKVTVDYKVLTLADESDVSDPEQGVGYEENGDASYFDYQDIEKIQVGPNIIDLDKLQTIMGNEKQVAKKEEPAAPAEETESEEEEEKEPGIEKSSYDIYLLGRELIAEFMKQKKDGRI